MSVAAMELDADGNRRIVMHESEDALDDYNKKQAEMKQTIWSGRHDGMSGRHDANGTAATR